MSAKRITVLTFLALGSAVACTETDGEGTSCTSNEDCDSGFVCGEANADGDRFCEAGVASCSADYDCSVEQICGAADADGVRKCEDAGVGASRTFGEADVSFSGSEAYLVTVYSLPRGEAAADEFGEFSLEGVSGNGGALTLRPASRPGHNFSEDPIWTARLAYEQKRREGIARLRKQVAEGERELFPYRRFQSAGSCAPGCSATEICYQGGCQSSIDIDVGASTVTADVVGTVTSSSLSVSVLLDATSNDAATATAANNAAQAFADAADDVLYILGLSGHSGGLDRDASGTMSVLFTPAVATEYGGSIVGLFDYRDFLPTIDSEATGNESDLLLAQLPTEETIGSCEASGACTNEITFELTVATLVHEYQHLASFATRAFDGTDVALESQETLWLDEGLSHTIEDLTGYGNSTQEAVATVLDAWSSSSGFATPNDTVEQRGAAYTFLRHLIDQRAKSLGASDASSSQVREAARAVYTDLLQSAESGFEHSLFQTLGAQGVGDWLVGLYTTNNSEVSEDLSSVAYLPVATASTTLDTGLDPYGTILTSRGAELTLTGPELGDGNNDVLDDLSSSIDGELAQISQGVFFIVEGLASGSTTIRATADASLDMHLRVERIR